MSANFDWQTEEDDRRAQNYWGEPPTPNPPDSSRRKPPWRLITIVVLLLAMVGALVWWRVDRRIEDTLQAFRTDVVASHNLVQRAVVEGDEEIFRSVLSGRDPAWTASELELFNEQLFVDRSPLGLIPVEGSLPVILPAPDAEVAAGEQIADIEFSADLNEAIVSINQPYQTEGTARTVVLQQTTIFRRGDSRWLLAPPLDEFWGDRITNEGDHLTLIYPARDSALAERLRADLDDEIGRMCATLEDINCSADLHLTVRLDTDPVALASLSQPLGALSRARDREDILELPTPTLVGLPVGDNPTQLEEGYQAIRNGYARHLLSAAIAQAVGWRCCEWVVLFEILNEYQLSELGLQNWPIDETDYQRVLDERLRISDFSLFQNVRSPVDSRDQEMRTLQTIVDYLVNGPPGLSAAEIQRNLDEARIFSRFISSRAAIVQDNVDKAPNNIDAAYWIYAFKRSAGPAETVPLPVDEDLYLACTAMDGNQTSDTSNLLRYSLDDGRWMEMYTLPGFIWMSDLPDPGMLLLQEFALDDETWRTNIWRDDGLIKVFSPADSDYSISFGESDRTGQKLVAYSVYEDFNEIHGSVIDLTDCGENGCATTELPGRPTWSPDGNWAIYVGDSITFDNVSVIATDQSYVIIDGANLNGVDLSLGPGDASSASNDLIPIASGRSPFWLNDQTFGYVDRFELANSPPNRRDDVIMLATIDDPTPRQVISATDLAQFLPDSNRTRRLAVGYVATHPNLPQLMFITLLDEIEQRAFVFSYDMDVRVPQLLMDLLYSPIHSLGFSPDGRYLTMTGQDQNRNASGDNSAVLLLHDIEENRTIPFLTRLPFFLPSVVYDWTQDGRWLAMAMEDNMVGLFAPDQGLVELLPHSYGACSAVAWLRP